MTVERERRHLPLWHTTELEKRVFPKGVQTSKHTSVISCLLSTTRRGTESRMWRNLTMASSNLPWVVSLYASCDRGATNSVTCVGFRLTLAWPVVWFTHVANTCFEAVTAVLQQNAQLTTVRLLTVKKRENKAGLDRRWPRTRRAGVKNCEKPGPAPLFIFSAVAGVCVVFIFLYIFFIFIFFISEVQTVMNCGCIDGCRSLNRSRILKFENVRTRGQEFWDSSGAEVWKCDSGHLCFGLKEEIQSAKRFACRQHNRRMFLALCHVNRFKPVKPAANFPTCSLDARVPRVSPTAGEPPFAPASLQLRWG